MIDLFECPGFELASARKSCGRDSPPSPMAPILRKLRRAMPSQNWLDGLPSRVSMAGSEKGGEQNAASCWVRSWQEWGSVSNPHPSTVQYSLNRLGKASMGIIHLWMLIESIAHACDAQRAAALKTNFKLTVYRRTFCAGNDRELAVFRQKRLFFPFCRARARRSFRNH